MIYGGCLVEKMKGEVIMENVCDGCDEVSVDVGDYEHSGIKLFF